MKTKKGFQIIVAILFVIMAISIVGCVTLAVGQTDVSQLRPGVYVEVVGKGYYNPNCDALRADPRAVCLRWVPEKGHGRITYYIGETKDDPFDGRWEANGRVHVHIDELNYQDDIYPGSGWYDPTSLKLVSSVSTPTLGIVVESTLTPVPTKKPTAIATPTPICFQYKLESGNTLFSLARKNDTSVSKITRDNAIPDPDKILVGDKIWICPGQK